MDTNVDVVNVNTGAIMATNVEQGMASTLMPDGGFDAGWRIRPHTGPGCDVISEQAVERVNAGHDLLRKADPSWVATPTVRSFGAKLQCDNDGRQTEVRAEWIRDPTPAVPRLEGLSGAIAGEHRADIPCNLRNGVNITDDGAWYLNDDVDGAVPMTPQAWKGLMAQVGSASRWLDGMKSAPTPVLVDTWRRFQAEYAPDKTVRAGVREFDDDDQLYRFVSDSYSDDTIRADQLIDILTETLRNVDGGDEYRAKALYSPGTTGVSIDVTRHAPNIPGMGAGDVFQTGFRFSTGDGGAHAVSARGIVLRNLCVNIQIVEIEEFSKARVAHKHGAEERCRDLVQAVFAKAHTVGDQFATLWTGAGAVKVRDVFPFVKAVDDIDGMRKVYEAMAAMRAMRKVTSAIAKDVAVEAMLLGWQREPGDDLRSLVNGVTRVHEGLVPVERVPLFEDAAMPVLKAMALMR